MMVTTVTIQNNRLWIYWCEVCTREFLSEAASKVHFIQCQKDVRGMYAYKCGSCAAHINMTITGERPKVRCLDCNQQMYNS